ncbi:MAG TPA: DnaA N-terminal domain-containing protein, partial [Terriglobales bacterium]
EVSRGEFERLRAVALGAHERQKQTALFGGAAPEPPRTVELEPHASPMQPTDAAETWAAVLRELEAVADRHTFDTWFRPSKGTAIEDGALRVSVPSAEFGEMFSRHSHILRSAARALRLPFRAIEFVTPAPEPVEVIT